MKILHVNKYFYRKGGAEIVFFNMNKLMESRGHEMIPFSMHDDKNEFSDYSKYFISNVEWYGKNISKWQKVKNLGRLFHSFQAKKNLKSLLSKTKPELVHLHNIYHQMSPSFLPLLKKKYNLPIVMTVHDYKLICPNYSMLSNGKVCEACMKNKYYKAIGQACHKASRLTSGILAVEMTYHKLRGNYNNIDALLCPSQFMMDKLSEWGIKTDKYLLPNFIDLDEFQSTEKLGDYLLYFGRLSEEKGIQVLLEALEELPESIKLKIVGAGNYKENLLQLIRQKQLDGRVEFLGFRKGQGLHDLIRNARLLILPSISYENCPLGLLEAFALGKPVLASDIGGIPELIKKEKEKYYRGELFQAGQSKDLAEKIIELWDKEDQLLLMGKNARNYVEQYHSADYYYEKLMEIYEKIKNK